LGFLIHPDHVFGERGNEVAYIPITEINVVFKGIQNTLLSYLEIKMLLALYKNNFFGYSMVNVNSKVVPARAMKAYRKNRGTDLLIPNLGTRWR
jgi:hypothetical protein